MSRSASATSRRLQGAAAAEDGQAGEELLLGWSSSSYAPAIVARSVCWRASASRAAFEQVEPLRQALEDLGPGNDARSGGGQLERERELVQAPAELGDRLVGLEPGAGAEELDAFALLQGRHRDSRSPRMRSSSRLVTRSSRLGQAPSSAARSGARSPPARSCPAGAEARARRSPAPGRSSLPGRGDRLGDEHRVAQGRERHPVTPAWRAGRARPQPRLPAGSCPFRPGRKA